jgi:hypothetical protein
MAVVQEEGDNRREWASVREVRWSALVWSRTKDVAFPPYLKLEIAKK